MNQKIRRAGIPYRDSVRTERALEWLFAKYTGYWKSFDYVMGWFWKARQFILGRKSWAAFVSTNSVCQGQLVSMFWPLVLDGGARIFFAYSSFKWRNLAANNAGVTVVIIGLSGDQDRTARLFSSLEGGNVSERAVPNINAYISPSSNVYVDPMPKAPLDRPTMFWGNKPTDGGHLLLTQQEARAIVEEAPEALSFLRPYFGSVEFINGKPRMCVWVEDNAKYQAYAVTNFASRFTSVERFRLNSKAAETRPAAKYPYKFRQIQGLPGTSSVIVPIHSSETRSYLPVGLLPIGSIISNAAYGLYEAPLWTLATIGSRLHLIWVATVCGKIKTDFRYSNTLGWNTFPVPTLTDKNKADLTSCAEDILLAREAHFPATIGDLYDPDAMPPNLREAHEHNDETLERIYIGRRFRNDTERLEKLFELYTEMTAAPHISREAAKPRRKRNA